MRLYLLLCSLLLSLCTPLAAEESPSYPGLEEIIPRATRITQESSATLAHLERNIDLAGFTARVEEARGDLASLEQRSSDFGAVDEWDASRLITSNGAVEYQQQRAAKLLDDISETLRRVETIRLDWSGKKDFWAGWSRALPVADQLPRESIDQAQGRINEVLDAAARQSDALLQLQRDISAVNTALGGLKTEIDAVLLRTRHEVFQRNALPLYAPELTRRLHQDLETVVPRVMARFREFDHDFLLRQGWQVALHLLTILALSIGFRIWQRHSTEETEEWLFLRQHPFAGALFIATVCWNPWYHTPPPMLGLLLEGVAVSSLAILAIAILTRPAEKTMMILLALVEFFSRAFTIVLLPDSLNRIYLALICVAALLYLGLLLLRTRDNLWNDFWFAIRLLIGGSILFIALIAQLAGFSLLATRLIEGSVATLFLFFYLVMAIRLGEGGIDFFLSLRPVRKLRFVRSLGAGSIDRLQLLYRILFIPAGLFSLVTIWGFSTSASDAWKSLSAARFAIGNFTLSVGMIGMIFFSLYLAYLASWLLQAFLDSQIFPGRGLDRGIRDAIKKLLHYALMISGFLAAVSIAGVDLQNFAILAGALGVGIGFGMQEIVSNFVSGLIILFERPIKVGDTIVIDGQWGEIAKIGMRSTVVATWDRAEIIVPNSHILSEKVVNWTLSNNVSRISLPVGVKYGTPMEEVLRIMIDCAARHEGVIADPPPSAIFTGFGESSLDFELRAWVSSVNDRLRVRSDLGVAIDKAFREVGIEIPFPQRDLHLRSIDLPTIQREQSP